ncbi:MAG: N(1)-aminopropylagmatine ureohydrolase [Chlamydiia bacterium]|nr:N(1)-aminopropylagmatine ureohydrolase [Chlamydiia bacterium]
MNKVIKEEFLENKVWKDLSYPRFMEFRCDYKKAKYVFNPVVFEREDSFIQNSACGPSAILKASHVIEKYNIATDSKSYLSGFFTKDAIVAMSEEEAADLVNKAVTNQVSEKKVPITLLGDGSGAIGAYYGLSKVSSNASILNIDAHLSLRGTMNGTRYHRFCKMNHAKKCFENVLHFGVSSMGNREKEFFDPDKVFFADDVLEDQYWLEDVMCELSEDVYISLDASIFDPSLLNSQNPDPTGITYKHVEKLLRNVAKKHNILGVDISGFVPNESNKAGEMILAKLIYDLISHIDA